MVTDGIQRESMDGKGEKGKKRKREKGRGGKGWVDGREGEEAGDLESLRGAEWFYQRRDEEIESRMDTLNELSIIGCAGRWFVPPLYLLHGMTYKEEDDDGGGGGGGGGGPTAWKHTMRAF
ncbi:hypothetical protein GB937_009693 [Aspergillus fischeri]|nr:hypothetical protein GB937_009693 [Aspergillus fischeri]